MIRIEFQNTLDDYREANGIPTGRRRRGAALRGALASVGTIVLLLLSFAILTMMDGDLAPGEPFPWRRLAIVLTPSVLLFGLFAWAVLRQAWKAPQPWNPPPKASRAPTVRGVLGWLLFFGLAACLLGLLNWSAPATPAAQGAAPPPPQRLPSYFEHVLPLLGWAFIIVALVVFVRLHRTRGIPTAWAAMRHEHEPRTLTVSESGVLIEQASARLEYRWSYFVGYRETDNLVLLYLSPYLFFMIPKRAFAEPGQLAVVKGLVMSGIPQGHFLPAASHAFPVMPTTPTAARPPPLPASSR